MIRIGNASGFYGDRFAAVREMLDGGPLDYLTGDYLAELTMLILGRDRLRDPTLGYAKTFLSQLKQNLGLARERGVKIVSNAGGLNPAGLVDAIRALDPTVRVGYVTGDAVERPDALAANAYLGAFGIAECLRAGAEVVVTGRVTDASLVVGPAIAEYGWNPEDLDRLAGATVAGHILECGTQATGGNYSFFTEVPDPRHPGFPIAEVHPDGSSVITKHLGTGGAVTTGTVTAQLLYEIGGPAYLGPDVVTRFDTIQLQPDGLDRVAVTGVRGEPPPPTLKVGVATLGGYRTSMTFILTGLDIEAKAELVRTQLRERIDGLEFQLVRTDRPDAPDMAQASALLHVHLRGPQPGRDFSRAAVELALASYPGCSLTTPPSDGSPYGIFRADDVPQESVEHVAVLPDGTRRVIKPPPLTAPPPAAEPGSAPGPEPDRPARRRPLGEIVGARSGDKGPDANLGVWARSIDGYEWTRRFLTTDRLRALLPEAADLPIDRYELPNLYALNFVLRDLLAPGVAGSIRFDPQAKGLGEWLRSRVVDVPEDLA